MSNVQSRCCWTAHTKHVSTDHDPLFRFHRWLPNLRILEMDEVKSVSCAPFLIPSSSA
jgi:hypothetical protein